MWPEFLPAAFLMAVIPGANQVLGLRNATLFGVRYALIGIVGRFSAFAFLVFLTVVGLGTVMARSVVVFDVVRWVGVAYLVWLGISTLRQAGRAAPRQEPRRVRLRDAARCEFVTALTNPKALLLFASFVPQFVPRGASATTLLLLAVAYIAVEAAVAAAYVAAGVVLGRRDGGLRVQPKRLDQAAGMGFLGFGGFLATAHRA